jgi:hypothetical protein
MSRDSYRASSFLDSRIRSPGVGAIEVHLGELLDAAPEPMPRRPCRFIFHIGHTCSTLLANSSGELSGTFVLREPAVLLDLARWEDRGRLPHRYTVDRWSALRTSVLAMLAKTYDPGDVAVIKPSSLANGAMREVLLRPAHRAVFVYSPLRTFLSSLLKSEDNRADGVADLAVRLRAGRGRFRATSMRRQPIARQLAALWILHMDLFLELLPTVSPRRLRSLDAEDFVTAPADTLSHLGRLFGLEWSVADIASVVEGPVFRSDAKHPGRPYDARSRRVELSLAADAFRGEIDDAASWAAHVTRDRPIPGVLPRRLGGARAA